MALSQPFKKITEVTFVKDRLLFPISWLHKQDFCEYQIYLENIKGIKVKPTKAMVEGKDEHESLYNQFAEKAVPATPEEMLTESKTAKILSREFRVLDVTHGVYGYIDEIWLTPEAFTIIDDKPGTKTYTSNIHQILGYCLAFKTIINEGDTRKIFAALRERGTTNIYWQAPFDRTAEEEIISIVYHIHALLSGQAQFKPTDNQNKCNSCRLKQNCDHFLK
jgi:CRISPR-associated exonuclease Cas4